MVSKTVLLADDDPHHSELIQNALKDAGVTEGVVHVDNAAEALDYLRRSGRFRERPPGLPVLMLLDLEMNHIGGFTVLEQMKRDPALRVVPVVCLASSPSDSDVARSYQLGANACVLKPLEPEQLVARFQRIGQFWLNTNEPPSEN